MKTIIYKNKKFNNIEFRYVNREDCKKDLHINYSLNILIIKSGSMQIKVKYKKYILEKNSVFIINPLEMHKCIKVMSNNIEYFVISIDFNWLIKMQTEIFSNIYLPIFINKVYNIFLYEQLLKYCNIFLKKGKISLKQYHTFYIHILTLIEEYSTKQAIANKDYLIINNVILHIKQNYKKNITVDNISSSLNYSSYILNSIFKKYFNITLNKLITIIKLYYSKKYLYKDYDIGFIAYEFGFYDQSHFHKHFKKNFELTPREYKINLKKI